MLEDGDFYFGALVLTHFYLFRTYSVPVIAGRTRVTLLQFLSLDYKILSEEQLMQSYVSLLVINSEFAVHFYSQ